MASAVRLERAIIRLILLASALAGAPLLSADDANYQNYIIGERAAGMGGAVIASACDLDSAYYNPAGLGFVTASRLSISTSLYGIYRFHIMDALGPGKNYDAREFETIPSTFGSVLNLSPRVKVALGAFISDDTDYNHRQTFERQPTDNPDVFQSEYFSYVIDDQLLWVGPSLGYQVDDQLSLGISVFGLYRSAVVQQNWTSALSRGLGPDFYSLSAFLYDVDFSNYGLLALLGVQYRPVDRLHLGLTVQTPPINLGGSGELLYAATSDDNDQIIHADGMDSRNRLPTRIGFGAAYGEKGNYTLEADVTYHLPTSYDQLEGEDVWTGSTVVFPLSRKPVVNANTGVEYYVMKNYPFRAGFFTNLSSAPDPDPQEPLVSEQIDMYGATLSVGNETEHTTMNLGVSYIWGTGETVGVGESGISSVVPTSESYLFLFLTAGYIF